MSKDREYDFSVNDRIDKILKERGISQNAFARKAGIEPSTFRGYMAHSHLSIESLQKISKALDVSVAYLLGEKDYSQVLTQLQNSLVELQDIISKLLTQIIESK